MHDRFFFLHVPKTAGVSLHHLLEQVAGPYLHLKYPHETRWPAQTVWARFRGCGGHLSWAEAQRRGFLDGFKLTFLRDPVERVLSQYSFSRQATGRLPDSLRARRLDFRQLLLQSQNRFGSFWNAQTNMLSGLNGDETSPEKHLESALENLERFDFVGITETFSKDLDELMQLLEGNLKVQIPSENRTVHRLQRDELDEETIAVLQKTQALDQALHDRARELRNVHKPLPLLPQNSVMDVWPPHPKVIGNGEATITSVTIREENGGVLSPGKEAEITICWNSAFPLDDLTVGFAIEDAIGNYIAGTNTFNATRHTFASPKGESRACFKFKVTMGAGHYLVNVALHRESQNICWINSAAAFDIEVPAAPYREGMVDVLARSHIDSASLQAPLPDSAAHLILLNLKGKPQFDLDSGKILISVRLVNGSDHILSSRSSCLLYVSYHWLSNDNADFVKDGLRSCLPRDVWPHEAVTLVAHVLPPPALGKWRLQLRIVQDGIRWHEGPGFESAVPQDLTLEYQEDGSIVLLITILECTELA